jgi:glucose-1-phosphatase
MNGDRPRATSHPPKAVIFDIGRVIVRVEPDRAVEALHAGTSRGRSGEQFWNAVLQDPRWNDWQEGRMEPREWHRHLARQLDIPVGFEDFCAAWNCTLHPETILNESWFVHLAERCRLAVLSNTDPLHSALLEAEFPFLRHFPARIYSCRVGVSKPAAPIYQAALDAAGVAAADALYIDDVLEYVEAARAMGIDAILFENPSQLSAEFVRRSLPGQ